jgi:tetratricopeptide (TPR) repeat protein
MRPTIPGGRDQMIRRRGEHSKFILLSLVGAAVVLSILFSCGSAANTGELAERMAAEDGRADDDERIAELKAEIRDVDKQVEKTIESVKQKGTYWRLLGLKYMDHRMWGEGLNAFDEAIKIYPEHAVLQYDRALCAGQMALASVKIEERNRYLSESETGYRRSLALDPRYSPAMYALSVLLVFELDRPGRLSYFLKTTWILNGVTCPEGFSLPGPIWLSVGRPKPLELYDEITRIAKNPADAAKAEELYARTAGGDYER